MDQLQEKETLFKQKCGGVLPQSVRSAIEEALRENQEQATATKNKLVMHPRNNPYEGIGRIPRTSFAPPFQITAGEPQAANYIASIEDALRQGWTIKSESGRQVVLTMAGQSVTMYRPKTKK